MAESREGGKQVCLALSKGEALVLLDFLGRLIVDEKGRTLRNLIHHDAEIWALNDLYLRLHRNVDELFAADYTAMVDMARSEVLTAYGGR